MDLFDYMNKYGYLGEAASKQVFKGVVETIIDMRGRGIIHGDIKDENILIDPKTGKTENILKTFSLLQCNQDHGIPHIYVLWEIVSGSHL